MKIQRTWSFVLTVLLTLGTLTISAVGAPAPAHAEANGVDPTPAMGWSSWSFLRKNPTETAIEAQADALHNSGLQKLGYRYVNLDDFWYECPGKQGPNVDSYGRWVIDKTRFPNAGNTNGIQATADHVHGLGLKFGLYMTPGISAQAVAKKTPIEGTSYTADQIATSTAETNYNCGGMVGIDYSKPGAQQFLNSWADQFASWGVDYLKLDGVGSWDIPDVKAWSDALRQTGRPIHLELSNSLNINDAATWKQYANGWRTGGDVECYCGANGSSYPLTDWSAIASRFGQVAQWAPYGGPGGFNDYDSIEVGNGSNTGLTPSERKTQLSLWALAASPLLLGTDLTHLDAADLALLKNSKVIAVDQDAIDATRLSSTSTSQVFGKREANGDGVAGLFNTGDGTDTVTTSTQALGLKPGKYLVTDLWTGASTETTGTISETVASHDVALVRVTPVNDPATAPPNTTLLIGGLDSLKGSTTGTVTESLTDNGTLPARDVALSVNAPSGWSLTPTSATHFDAVESGQTVTATFKASRPAQSTVFQSWTVTGDAHYTWARKTALQMTARAQLQVPGPAVQAPYQTYSSATDAAASYAQLGQQFGISGAGKPMYSGYGDGYSAIYRKGAVGSTFTVQTEVTAEQNMSNFWAQAGITVRNDVTGSGTTPQGVTLSWGPNPSLGLNIWWSDNGGDYLNNVLPNDRAIDVNLPVWLKLTRSGDVYTGYYSTDGTTWTEVGSATVPDQSATQDAGMFVSSGEPGQPAEATFNGFTATNQ